MLLIENGALPELTMVTHCDALHVPTVAAPNGILAVDKVTCGPTPVPLRTMLCGEPRAL
jgi:hypothetical protein